MKELTIKEIQEVSLEILHTVAQICEKYHFRYTLVYGTLIGAVRHKGYIPWDDDVDIMMPRPDYDKFLDYFKKNNEKYPNLKLFNHKEVKSYPYMISRICDDRYTIKTNNEKPCGMGIFIDIYPYDGLGMTKKESVSFGLKGDHLSSLCFLASRLHFEPHDNKKWFEKILLFFAYVYAKTLGKDYFQRKLEKMANVKSYDESNYIGCVTWLSWGEKDIFKREWFDETIMTKFEKYQFRIPKEYDKILRHEYGDYMKLPSEEDRVGHHYFRAYKKSK